MRGRLHHIIDTMQIFHFKKQLYSFQVAHPARANRSFSTTKRLGILLLSMDRTAVYSKLPPTPPPRFLWQFAGTHVYSSQSSVAQRVDNAIQRIRVNKIVQCFHCKESDPTDSLIHPSNNRDLGREGHCWVKYPARHHIIRDPTRSRTQTSRPREQRANR